MAAAEGGPEPAVGHNAARAAAGMKNQPFLKRLGFAWSGFAGALTTESSFKVQTLAAIAALVVLAWWRAAPLWWAIVLLTIVTVLAAELLNTAIEHLADQLHPERHPEIKKVKDYAAAAVLVASTGALAVAAVLAWAVLHG